MTALLRSDYTAALAVLSGFLLLSIGHATLFLLARRRNRRIARERLEEVKR